MSPLAPMELEVFFNDPWWVVTLKALFAFVILLLLTLFTIWYERRVLAFMQQRQGPNMNGPFGLLQSLADGMKLMFKEDFTPTAADKVVFMLAPFVVAIPAITAFAVIPMAGIVRVPFTEITTPLQVTDLPVSVLFIVAVASIGVYGIVLAGWSSGSTYSLLGALRSSAQVISYEVAMGLALVAVFLYAGSLSTSEIVAKQAEPATVFGVPVWFAVQLLPSFIIYLISMVGETNRAPFDLPEAEGELVGGFHTEYSSMRFAMFFMAEYMNMITVSALAVTLFLGGWHAPLPFRLEFFGDQIESLREFDIDAQTSVRDLRSIDILLNQGAADQSGFVRDYIHQKDLVIDIEPDDESGVLGSGKGFGEAPKTAGEGARAPQIISNAHIQISEDGLRLVRKISAARFRIARLASLAPAISCSPRPNAHSSSSA